MDYFGDCDLIFYYGNVSCDCYGKGGSLNMLGIVAENGGNGRLEWYFVKEGIKKRLKELWPNFIFFYNEVLS